jgi:hypothetical protein
VKDAEKAGQGVPWPAWVVQVSYQTVMSDAFRAVFQAV